MKKLIFAIENDGLFLLGINSCNLQEVTQTCPQVKLRKREVRSNERGV